MSLIKCPECEKEISSEATCCPHCGFPVKKSLMKEDSVPRVIAFRGEPGSIKGITIFDFVFGILFFVGAIVSAILSISSGLVYLLIFISIFFLAGVLGVTAGIVGFVRMSNNSKNTHNCIEYNKEQNKLILYKINGEKISISPDKYVSLKDNLFTDNILFFTYIDSSGKRRKANLGYCANRDEIRSIIEKLRSQNIF